MILISHIMDPRYRVIYLVGGFAFLLLLGYEIVSSFPEINPKDVLKFTVPSLVFFFLAYKTYPEKDNELQK
jgi:hypothetical protein